MFFLILAETMKGLIVSEMSVSVKLLQRAR